MGHFLLASTGGGTVLVPGLFYLFSYLGFEQSILMHMAVGGRLLAIIADGLFGKYEALTPRATTDFIIALKHLGSGLSFRRAASRVC
jgi:hypothetical protein